MRDDIADIIAKAETKGWKRVEVEFGDEFLEISVPSGCETLHMKKMPHLANSTEEIFKALNNPIGTPKLWEIIKSKGKPTSEVTVCISVSDITRPVPYKGEKGILLPLLEILEGTGIARDNIVLVVGTGMHRASTMEEKRLMFGAGVVDNYRVVDHNCEDLSSQVLAAAAGKGYARLW